MISKKDAAFIKIENLLPSMRCPHCFQDFKLNGSLKCLNNHSFDISKHGYLNLENKGSDALYNKDFFENRYQVLTSSNYYQPLIELLNKEIINHHGILLDAACGEGSFLNRIQSNHKKIGIDLSKDGIALATKHFTHPQFLIADLSKIPLKDDTTNCILSILSPANYAEFKRVMVRGAQIIKVIPGKDYFMEVREYFKKDASENNAVLERFAEEFPHYKQKSISYNLSLDAEDRMNICAMSPLTWNASEETLDSYIKEGPKELSIDLIVLIARKGEQHEFIHS